MELLHDETIIAGQDYDIEMDIFVGNQTWRFGFDVNFIAGDTKWDWEWEIVWYDSKGKYPYATPPKWLSGLNKGKEVSADVVEAMDSHVEDAVMKLHDYKCEAYAPEPDYDF